MSFIDDIEELVKYFGLSVENLFQGKSETKQQQPPQEEKKQTISPSMNGFSRVTTVPSKELQDTAQKYLGVLTKYPYGSYIPFESNGTKYRAVLEEHVGGRVSGPHPGISLFVEGGKPQGSFVDTGDKVQFQGQTYRKLDGDKQIEGKFRIPATGAFVSRYAPSEVNKTHPTGHHGVDIGANKGTPVYAIGPGFVSSVTSESTNPKGGNAVITVHNKGEVSSYYAHLDSTNVIKGQRVDQNTVIGTIGNSGNAKQTAPHLHWEVKVNGREIDPLNVTGIDVK